MINKLLTPFEADTYHPLRSFSNGAVRGSVIDIQNEKENSGLRRALGGVFSAKNVLDFEADLDIAIDALMDRLKRGGTDDIFETMQQFQIDFLMKIAFSEAPEFLKTGQSTVSWSFEARYRHWKSWQAVPKLEYLFYKSPLVTKFLKTTTPAWARMARERLQARESKGVIFSKGNDLLDKYMASREGHPELLDQGGLLRMVTSTISAGFDTTAFTMSTMLYYLLQNPSCLKELREELDGANLSDRPNWNEVHKLPYLDAVMKEAMRCYPFLDLLLERVVPRGGAQICGTFLPGGTVVGCDALVVHRDRGVFGDEVEAFMPERWLIDDPSRVLAMERAFLSFGSGKRVCLGRHLAGLEVKKLIPKLLNMFEVCGSVRGRPLLRLRLTSMSCLGLLGQPKHQTRVFGSTRIEHLSETGRDGFYFEVIAVLSSIAAAPELRNCLVMIFVRCHIKLSFIPAPAKTSRLIHVHGILLVSCSVVRVMLSAATTSSSSPTNTKTFRDSIKFFTADDSPFRVDNFTQFHQTRSAK